MGRRMPGGGLRKQRFSRRQVHLRYNAPESKDVV